jgi:hypothetical protein
MGLTRRTRGSRVILPIRPDVPGPVLDLHLYYVIDGVPIHYVGERWRKEDAAHCPYPTVPDPHNPNLVLTYRLIDGVTGDIIPDVSCAVHDRLAAARRAILASSSRGRRTGARAHHRD